MHPSRFLPVDYPHKGQWRGALMFSLICTWTKGWANNRGAGDLWRHRAYYGVIVMKMAWHDICQQRRRATWRKTPTLSIEPITNGWNWSMTESSSNSWYARDFLGRIYDIVEIKRRYHFTQKLESCPICGQNAHPWVSCPIIVIKSLITIYKSSNSIRT